jgi:glycosyltransferase involved in cell wall biosynthesis/GT2 family glycosyltransferase
MPSLDSHRFHFDATPSLEEQARRYRGWFLDEDDRPVWAIRAWCGPVRLTAQSGMPRPDVARCWPHLRLAGISGFEFDLPAGSAGAPDRLEWLGETGCWREFWRNPNVPEAATASAAVSRQLRPFLIRAAAHETAGLRWRAALKRVRDLVHRYDGQDAAALPDPAVSYHLDEPAACDYHGPEIRFGGWAFHFQRRFRRLFVRAGPAASVSWAYPILRPDVVTAFQRPAEEAPCGFAGVVQLSVPCAEQVYFRLYGEHDDGTVVLIAQRRWRKDHPPVASRAAQLRSRLLVAAALRAVDGLPRHRNRDGDAAVPPPIAPTPPQPSPCIIPASGAPWISLLTPVFNPPAAYLSALLTSVQAQSYPRWEFCLADDASTEPHVRPLLEDFARREPRARVIFRESNGQISRATNSALALATGGFVALLDHDDLLPPDALRQVADAIVRRPETQFLYTDRDKIDDSGRHYDHELRCGWNPAMALTHNYVHQLTVMRRTLIERAGGFRADLYGSQDLDLYLRCLEHVPASAIVHLPILGYHWRAHPGSTATRGDQKDYMFDSARRAIADALGRRGLRAEPFLPEFATRYGLNLHQLRWDRRLLLESPVTIVVAVMPDLGARWPAAVAALANSVPPTAVEIIIAAAGDALGSPPAQTEAPPIRCITCGADAGLAELLNRGAAQARHPRLLLLVADLAPRTAQWLEDLSGWLSQPDVGAVGPKLIAADGRLRSAGWTIRPDAGVPHPLFAGSDPEELGLQFLPQAARDAAVLDPACVLTDTKRFRELGGFDTRRFPDALFAADYCLRLREHGLRCVVTPQAVLAVGASGELALSRADRERPAFRERHPDCADPWLRPDYLAPLPEVVPSRLPARSSWMADNTHAFLFGWVAIESPAPGVGLGCGHQRIHGWCLARPGEKIVEVRIAVHDRVRPAIFGQSRSDVAAKLGVPDADVPAGFQGVVKLAAGSNPVRIEAFVARRGWVVSARLEWIVGAEPSPDRLASRPPERLTQFRTDWVTLLEAGSHNRASLLRRAGEIAREAPRSDETLNPAAPFYGHLDLVAGSVTPIYGGIQIGGWVLHQHRPIQRVFASAGGELIQPIESGLPSPHIGRHLPGHTGAECCAFAGWLPLPADRTLDWFTVRVWVELPDGSRHLVMAQPTRPIMVAKTNHARVGGVSSITLLHACAAMLLALRAAGHAPPPWSEIVATWRLLRARYPRPVSPAPPGRLQSPRPIARAPAPTPHLVLVSHNLNREGAPLFLLDLAHAWSEQRPLRLTVVSPEDGELRTEFEACGARVRLVDRQQLWSARSARAAHRALEALAATLAGERADLVVANTIESFWAVHAAARHSCPTLFYVHEPGVLGVHYPAGVAAAALPLAAAALRMASIVLFPNAATRAYYADLSPGGRNYRCLPGWTRAADRLPATPTRKASLRAALGLAPHELVVINVGTLSARKGQLTFVAALDRLRESRPALASLCRFLIVGANDNAYGAQLARLLETEHFSNVSMISGTPHVQDYFDVADLFVASSFEEGFPRVLLEAMAAAVPIVCTAINGVPEIVHHREHALLVPPGAPEAMADAMAECLVHPVEARLRAQRARSRVSEEFSAARVIPQHTAVLLALLGVEADAARTTAPDSAASSPATSSARSDRQP